MSESRVDRLLRLAEEAAVNGDSDKCEDILTVLAPAIYVQRLKALQNMTEKVTVEHD